MYHEHLAIFQECIDFTRELAKDCNCKCAEGPIKSLESALRKGNLATNKGGYGGDLTKLKDLLRFTIIAPDLASIYRVRMAIAIRAPQRNWEAFKNNVVAPTLENAGNGGLNAALRRYQAGGAGQSEPVCFEIQANTPRFLYGKESETGFNVMFADNTGQTREQMKSITKVAGGLGHVLYEIVRGEGAASPATREKANELSYRYYDYLRGACNAADPGYSTLCAELTAFVNSAEVVPYFKGKTIPANVAVFPQVPPPVKISVGHDAPVELQRGRVADMAQRFNKS
jgi:hypothetical protein